MTLTDVIILAIAIVCCDGDVKENSFYKEHAFADQMCSYDHVHFQTVTKSAVSCVRKCSEKSICKSLVYLTSNNTCFGIKSDNPFGTFPSPLPGAVFYKPYNSQLMTTSTASALTTTSLTPTSTTTATPAATSFQPTTTIEPGTRMVEGLSDSQFNASSVMCTECAPWQARFNSTDFEPWIPAIQDTHQWLQVDFSKQIIATHVTTKGHMHLDEWVSSYKILTSTNCINFVTVTDNLGNDKVFGPWIHSC